MTTRDDSGSGKPWGGRFRGPNDPLVQRYTGSLHIDRRLAREDLRGSRAHVRMLARQSILSEADRDRILAGLDQIETEIEQGTFPFREELEDIHMNIEVRLQELVGEAGGRLHTGRSRNDQVALDVRLFCLNSAEIWRNRIVEGIEAICRKATGLQEDLFPGWTHMQAAQPLSWAHYLLAFAEMLGRDHARLESYSVRNSVSPLGAGALSGSSLPLDPASTAREMGFREVFRNSYDVAGDRDAVLELSQIGTLIMIHLSRLAEDFIYFASTPVGWIDLPDALCTGSSMMPQKKNPDLLELMRGKSASAAGHCTALSVLLKGLPTSYQRDLQQDKEHLFAVVDLVSDSLEVAAVLFSGLTVRTDAAGQVLKRGFLMATELAEYLVGRGVPFRTAHRQVGELVRHCLESGISLEQLSDEDARRLLPQAGADWREVLRPACVLERRTHSGSTGRTAVAEQLHYWTEWLAGRRIGGSGFEAGT